MEWFHRIDDASIDAELDGGASVANRIAKGAGGGVAVGLDADAIDSEEWGATVFVGAGAVFDGLERSSAKECPDEAEGIPGEFALDPLDHRFRKAFDSFKEDISGEAVTDHNICWAVEDPVSLDIANEADWSSLKQGMAFLVEVRPFGWLCANVQEGDACLSIGNHRLVVDAAHDSEPHQMPRRRVDIRTSIDKQEYAALGWNEHAKGSPLNAGKGAEFDSGRCHKRPRVSGGYHSIRLAGFYKVDGAADG